MEIDQNEAVSTNNVMKLEDKKEDAIEEVKRHNNDASGEEQSKGKRKRNPRKLVDTEEIVR